MADDDRKGLSVFDGVLIVGGGLIAVFVAFALIHVIAGLIWFAIEVLVVVVLAVIVGKLIFGRRS